MKPSAIGSRRVVIVDTGPLVAAIDANDPHHRWARAALLRLSASVFTCEAVVAEAGHLLDNHPIAIEALRTLASRMEISPILREHLGEVFDLMERFAPNMDVADAWLVALAAKMEGAIVLITDTRDFSTYRLPFASPAGLFSE